MFKTHWQPAGFDRMQQLIRDYPELRAGFIYTLESIAIELAEAADTFGESRTGNRRLGFVGILSVLIRVDSKNRIARVLDVRLQRRIRRS